MLECFVRIAFQFWAHDPIWLYFKHSCIYTLINMIVLVFTEMDKQNLYQIDYLWSPTSDR